MGLTDLSADELSTQLRSGQVSAREVMGAYLERISALNPKHNAIVNLADGDELLALASTKDDEFTRARTSGEAVGWMHGMPQAIKDLTDAAGFPTTLGSPLLANAVAKNDSLMVQRMKAAGCIVMGKTNAPEFGLGSHTFNEVFGVTPNAYDQTKSAGGSSGGAAVALATRMLPVADGSDYGGSLRNPAAWNNIFGFRPSQGLVPLWPTNEVWLSQMSTEGPMGRSVLDMANLLQIQAGYDARAPLSQQSTAQFTVDLDRAPTNLRIGWLGDLDGYLPMEPGIVDVCERGLRRFETYGYSIEPTALGFTPDKVWDAWCTWRGWLVGPRVRPFMNDPATRAQVKPEAQWEYEQGLALSAGDIMQASVRRTAFYQHLVTMFDRFDVLAIPTAQVWPFDAALRWPSTITTATGVTTIDTYHRWMEVAIYATFAGLPAVSVPVGFNEQGLAMGVQLIGKPRGDKALLQIAHAYEQTIGDLLAVRPA
jgi:amidase